MNEKELKKLIDEKGYDRHIFKEKEKAFRKSIEPYIKFMLKFNIKSKPDYDITSEGEFQGKLRIESKYTAEQYNKMMAESKDTEFSDIESYLN